MGKGFGKNGNPNKPVAAICDQPWDNARVNSSLVTEIIL